MWDRGTRQGLSATGARQRGTALVLVSLLLLVLSAFAGVATSHLLSALRADGQRTARSAAFYVAEAARAHAMARIAAGAGSETSGVLSLTDDQGEPYGQYSFAITDITLPEQDPRRRVQVDAWWPTADEPAAEYQVTLYMQKSDGTWTLQSYAPAP